MTKRVRVVVSGRVQGVFFRAETAARARRLGLGGLVRNTADGRVEAVFEGDVALVDEMVEWCHQGPPFARVDRVETMDEQPLGENEFHVTH